MENSGTGDGLWTNCVVIMPIGLNGLFLEFFFVSFGAGVLVLAQNSSFTPWSPDSFCQICSID